MRVSDDFVRHQLADIKEVAGVLAIERGDDFAGIEGDHRHFGET